MSFELGADGVYRIEKDPDDTDTYAIQWYDKLRGSDQYWAPRIFVRPGETFTPSRNALNDHRYKATIGGKTGVSEPVWLTEADDEIVDGGVTWQEIGAEDSIATSTWDAGGLTASAPSVDSTGRVAQVDLSGLLPGHEYVVRNRIVSVQGKTRDQSFIVVMKPH